MTVNEALDQVLKAISPNRTPAYTAKQLDLLKSEVIEFLKTTYPMHTARRADPSTMGSEKKGTAIATASDVDIIVPFRHGYTIDLKSLRQDVENKLCAHFQQGTTDVRKQRFSLGVRRMVGASTIRIDVVPAMENRLNGYVPSSPHPQDKVLVIFDHVNKKDRTTNVAQQIALISGIDRFHGVIRLLKAWKHHENNSLGSYAVELMVYDASKAKPLPESNTPADLLKHVLKHMIPFLEKNGSLTDIGANYPWPDFVKPETKTQLAGRLNKMLLAIERKDGDALRSFFP